jgi:hypothetical protein
MAPKTPATDSEFISLFPARALRNANTKKRAGGIGLKRPWLPRNEARSFQRTRKTSLPRKWRDSLKRCAATASLSR